MSNPKTESIDISDFVAFKLWNTLIPRTKQITIPMTPCLINDRTEVLEKRSQTQLFK